MCTLEMIELPKNINLNETPYKHFFAQYHISAELDQNILNWLRNDAPWILVEKDFYTQYEFSFLDIETPTYLNFIKSSFFLDKLKKFMEKSYNVQLQSKFSVVAHKLVKGHVIKIHNDYLEDDSIRESHRLLLHFNRDWSEYDGGYCMIFANDNPNSLHEIIAPNNFLLQSFAISENSHHAVSEVKNSERFTIIFTFYK